MKKNFFKKLSFVLALAMIVSVIAPAAGAFAASNPALSSAKKYLFLGEDGKNAYNFTIKNKPADFKGAKYAWKSANEAVAVVDAGNTTAVGVGTTKVSVVVTKTNGKKVTLSSDVVVKDNISEISTIYMQTKDAPALDKLVVATDYDFGRTYKTKSGATKGTTSVTRWFVDSAKATVSDAGVFNATEAGTYEITAVAFQSKAKYDAWAALKNTSSTVGVLATKSVDVTVSSEMKSVAQVTLSTAKVTFASATADAASKITVSKMVGTTPVKQLVKSVVAVDATKNTEYTITMYLNFEDEATYVVSYPGMKDVTFKAAKAAKDKVAKIEVSTVNCALNTGADLAKDTKLFNADGVDITNDTLKAYVSYTVAKDDANKANIFNSNMSMWKLGDVAKVTATYHTYSYDTTGNEVGAINFDFTVTAVAASVTAPKAISVWTIATSAPDFTKTANHAIAVKDSGKIYVQATQNNVDTKIDNATTDNGFSFTSSDQSVLITDASGNLFPVKAGAAVVIVKYNNNVFEAINVTVNPEKVASYITCDSYGFNLSNSDVDNTKDVVVKVFNQYDTEMGTAAPVVTKFNDNEPTFYSVAGNKVTFNAKGVAAGQYAYKITSNNFTKVVTVTVGAPDKTAAADLTYRIKLSASTVDLAIKDGDSTRSVVASIWGYAPNGVAVTAAAVSTDPVANTTGEYKIKITRPNGTTYNFVNGTYTLLSAVSGAVLDKTVFPVGTYQVTAYKTETVGTNKFDRVIDQTSFVVTDTQVKPVLASIKTQLFTSNVNSTAATDASLVAAVVECFKITLDGKEVAVADIASVKATGTTTAIYVESVDVYTKIDGAFVKSTVNVGLNINKK